MMRENKFFFCVSIEGDGGRVSCDFTAARTRRDNVFRSGDGKIMLWQGLFGWQAFDDDGRALTWLPFRTKEVAATHAIMRGWE